MNAYSRIMKQIKQIEQSNRDIETQKVETRHPKKEGRNITDYEDGKDIDYPSSSKSNECF